MTIVETNLVTKDKEVVLPPNLVYAGASHKRTKVLQMVLGNRLRVHPFPYEPHDWGVEEVARYKRAVALNTLGLPPKESLVIAADTQTCIVLEDGSLSPRNKPKSRKEVEDNFREMDSSREYELMAATTFFHNGTTRADTLRCRVRLFEDSLRKLRTPEGMGDYCALVERFYSEPPYSTHNFPPMNLGDMSGGISLPALRMMGAIEAIDGNRLDQLPAKEQRDVLSEALFTVAVGLSPVLLEELNPMAREIIYNWPWLQETTAKLVKRC